ncbi:hypothetical protein [uncultured Kordia sp.]|uniref:hypothetical protein n=1 Tax=uncultured Kordia sp. TaxID=507699 RepID=UPI00260F8708|nr:hypothetical protein [uncultured Kordia sp.]
MNLKKLFFLVLICNFLFGFTHSDNLQKTTIYIVKSSERLSKTNFELKEGTVMLNTKKDYKFYVEITAKETSGHLMNRDFSKTPVDGIQYKVTYTYEHLPSGKKNYYKDKYIVWESGAVINLKPAQKINIGKITLRTKTGKQH